MKCVITAIIFLLLPLCTKAEMSYFEPYFTGKKPFSDIAVIDLKANELKALKDEIHRYTKKAFSAKPSKYTLLNEEDISLKRVCLPNRAIYGLYADLLIYNSNYSKNTFYQSSARIKGAVQKLLLPLKQLPNVRDDLDVEATKEILAALSLRDQQVIALPVIANELAETYSALEQEALLVLVNKIVCDETERHGLYAQKLLDEYGWPEPSEFGREAGFSLWLVFQHLDSKPALQKSLLRVLEEAVAAEVAEGSWYAYLYDRVMINNGKKQLYGTQLSGCGLRPLKDPQKVNKRRAALGMETLISYLSWVPNCADVDVKTVLAKAGITTW